MSKKDELAISAFLEMMEKEVHQAIDNWPAPNPTLAKLTEEAGEVATELVDIREGRSDDWHLVYKECIQTAAMACRIAIEGDGTLGAVPTEENQ